MLIIQAVFIAVFSSVGLLLFYACRDSIVIKNRLPKLVYFETISTIFTGLLASIDNDVNVNKYVPCWILYGIYGPVSLFSITLVVCRISYVYGYLVRSNSKIQVRRVFWVNNTLQMRSIVIVFVVLTAGTWANSFGFYISNNHWSPPVNSKSCPDPSLYFAQFLFMVFTICILYLAAMILYRRAFDKIGMSFELVGYGTSIFLLNIVFLLYSGNVTSFTVYLSCILNNFFSLYFPCLVFLRHKNKLGFKRMPSLNKKKSLASSGMLLDDKVQLLCKHFLCEENGVFIKKFKEYKIGKLEFEVMRELFFVPSALFELNISHDLRTSLLASDNEDERQKVLEKIHQEVVQMVKDNILPYLDKEEL